MVILLTNSQEFKDFPMCEMIYRNAFDFILFIFLYILYINYILNVSNISLFSVQGCLRVLAPHVYESEIRIYCRTNKMLSLSVGDCDAPYVDTTHVAAAQQTAAYFLHKTIVGSALYGSGNLCTRFVSMLKG